MQNLITRTCPLLQLECVDFQHVFLDTLSTPPDLNPDINDLVSDKSIRESKKHWLYERNIVAYREKHKQPVQYLAKCGFKRLVKALVTGRLDNVRTMLAPFCAGKLESEMCITVPVPKEKKLKIKGRYFSGQ